MARKAIDNEGYLDLDKSVAAFLSQGEAKEINARLPKSQRKARAKEQRHNQERRGSRATYDLTPQIISDIKDLADNHRTTASQIVALALSLFMDRINNDSEFLKDFLILTPDTPRYENRVLLKPKEK